MYSDPDRKRIRPIGIFSFLPTNEPLQPSDLVRRVTYASTHSDYVDYSATREMDWTLVSEFLPGWIGKTLDEYYDFPSTGHTCKLEVIRQVAF